MLVVARMLPWGLVLLVLAVISVEGEPQLYHLRESVGLPGSFRYSPDTLIYSVIQKDGLNFVRLYFVNYTWCVSDLHNI